MNRNPLDATVCVILAGGQGKRMASAERHKVCFPLLDRPAIVRAIDAYKAAGLKRFLVVVGAMAQQVMDTISAVHPEVTYVYQAQPRGTGHAVAVATEALAEQGHRGTVLITMGDKIIQPAVVADLLARCAGKRADLVLATLPRPAETSAGRVVTDSQGRLLGIVEKADIDHQRRTHGRIRLAGRRFSAEQIERRSGAINASLYVFRFEALRQSINSLRSDNVQKELYLTDAVEHLVRSGARVLTHQVANPEDLMAFNTPAELLAIEAVLHRREKPSRVVLTERTKLTDRVFKPAAAWLKALRSPASRQALWKIYGRDESLIEERRQACTELVERFARRFGTDRPMVLSRAPGRINLMGRHVDHRGGFVNVMAISREVLVAAAPREDDVVRLLNLRNRRFPPRTFRLVDLLKDASWTDWMDFVSSRTVKSVLESAPGDWSHYARAPLLRLQHESRQTTLKGMDCLVGGNIPTGAGLSSSSALVVAFAQAAIALNGLNVTMRDFIDLCGEGEWFVGSRGGSADHAAIRGSRPGYISKIGFFPFHIERQVRFPSTLHVVVAHCGTQAVKSASARDVFNQRISCYGIAEMLLKNSWPAAAGMEHLRDLTPQALKVQPREVYRALMLLPENPTRRRLERLIKDQDRARLERLFATHADLGGYDLRGVALFGIGECLRSQRFADLLAQGDLKRIGDLMRISHDGDRCVQHDGQDRTIPHLVRLDDPSMLALARADADPVDQCGRYACSTEAIDLLVDTALETPGVIGAQLAGAGLGGCMMILVESKAMSALLDRLNRSFYTPRSLAWQEHVYVCRPVAGAGLLAF